MRVPTLFLAALFLVTACASDDGNEEGLVLSPAERRLPLQTWEGQASVADKPFVRLAASQDDWAFFWSYTREQPPRALNEGQEIAAFVFIGERASAGHQPVISALLLEGNEAALEWIEFVPGEAAAQVISYPWAIALFPHQGEAPELVEEQVIPEEYR